MPYPQNPIGTKARKPSNGVKVPTELLVEALRKTKGNIGRAADKVGICRQTFHTRLNQEPELKAYLDTFRERFLDDLEDVFQNKALDGDTTSGMFLLKTIGKRRGYDMNVDIITESATRAALDFVFNKSKSPVQPS